MLSTAKKRLKILKDMKGWWDLNEYNKKILYHYQKCEKETSDHARNHL